MTAASSSAWHAPLAEVRGHGVGGVAEQRDPAAVEGRQRRGQLGDIMAQYALRPGQREQSGDRLVPGAEEPDQLGEFVASARAGGCWCGRVAVDPPVGQRHDAEYGAAPPALRHGDLPGRRTGDQAPGSEPRVAEPLMAGKQCRARRGTDPVGGHDEVGIQLARCGRDARRRRPAIRCLPARLDRRHLGCQGEHATLEAGRQGVDHRRPRQQDNRVPEPVRDHPAAGAAHQPPAVGPADAHFLRNRQAPELGSGAHHVQCPQSVGTQCQCNPDRLKRRRTLTDGDVPVGEAQPYCRRQAADSRTDHDRTRSCHPGAPSGWMRLLQPVA